MPKKGADVEAGEQKPGKGVKSGKGGAKAKKGAAPEPLTPEQLAEKAAEIVVRGPPAPRPLPSPPPPNNTCATRHCAFTRPALQLARRKPPIPPLAAAPSAAGARPLARERQATLACRRA